MRGETVQIIIRAANSQRYFVADVPRLASLYLASAEMANTVCALEYLDALACGYGFACHSALPWYRGFNPTSDQDQSRTACLLALKSTFPIALSDWLFGMKTTAARSLIDTTA